MKATKSLAAQLWAMTGPAEGRIIFGVKFPGDIVFNHFTDIREALQAVKRGACEVREFWALS